MKKIAIVAGLVTAVLPAVAATQTYTPKVGDHMWVIVRQFPARNYQKAKAQYVREIWSKLKHDALTRDHILAEDRAHHRLAVVLMQDVRRQLHQNAASKLDRLASSKRSDWYRIAMINDEKIDPAVGDDLILYENRYPKALHESVRKVQEQLMAAMRKDGIDKDSYVTEMPNTGRWGGIAIVRHRDSKKASYAPWAKSIAKGRIVRKEERFRIIGIQDE